MPGPTGALIRTYSGREVNPLNLGLDDIDIRDIAHSLALCNRFIGHSKKPISVAQHSVYVSRIAFALTDNKLVAKQGVLHDAAEAYLGDVTRWLKRTPEMYAYREAEQRVEDVIFYKFGCERVRHPAVGEADRIMVRFEGQQGFGKDFKIDHPNYPPLTDRDLGLVGKWGHWTWKVAEDIFLSTYRMCET